MKKTLFMLAVVLFAASSPAADRYFTNRYDTITTTDGTLYNRVSLKRQEGSIIVFFHSSGIAEVLTSDMPDNVLSDIGLQTNADRAHAAHEAAQKKAQFSATQRAKGLVEYYGAWITPQERDFRQHIRVRTDTFEGTQTYSTEESIGTDDNLKQGSMHVSFQMTEEIENNSDTSPVLLVLDYGIYELNGESNYKNRLDKIFSAWRYEHKRDLIFMLDGDTRIKLGSPSHKMKSQANSGDMYYAETMWTPVTREDFKKIADAKHVKFRLGEDVYGVPFKNRESMRVFSTFLESRSKNVE